MSSPRRATLTSAGSVRDDDDLISWVTRTYGSLDVKALRRLLGQCNEFKEGDALLGIAASTDQERHIARLLLRNTTVGALVEHCIYKDRIQKLADDAVDSTELSKMSSWRMGELVQWLLGGCDSASEAEKTAMLRGLPSDVIACVVKLCSNDELVAISQRFFAPLPNSKIGSKGYMGARIQPNSPTDDPEDVVMQVLSAWAYGVGDVILGTNPVSAHVDNVAAVERGLRDLLFSFGVQNNLPHCVLTHVDIANEVERTVISPPQIPFA